MSGFSRRIGFFVVCLFGLSPAFAAAEPVTSQTDPESSLVSPSRIPGLSVNASQFPGSATILTQKDIEASGAQSLPELLARQAGVNVMDTHGFGLGADSSVNLRGMVNGSRTDAVVLVDGVRQNRVTGDEVHWQSIPVEAIDRIEIIRGGSSLIYGEGALGGVINIITRKGAATTEHPVTARVGAAVGTYGRFKYFTEGRGRSGPATYGASFHRTLIHGYRESTNSRGNTGTAHAGLDISPELHVETNILASEDTTYFPGGITQDQSQARRRQRGAFNGFIEDHSEQAAVQAVWHTPAGMSVVTDAFIRDRESDSAAPDRLATLAPSMGLSIRSAHDADITGDVHHTFVNGVDLLEEKASTGFRTGTYSESNKAGYGIFLEETLRLYDRASIVAGVRYDRARYEEAISFPAMVGTLRFEGWSPKIGASFDVVDSLTAYATFSRPYKAPNVDDFSVFVPSIFGFTFVGNIDLQPQQGTEYETGLRFKDERFGSASAAVFYSQIDDEILFNAVTFQNQNFDTHRSGLELTVRPALPIPHLTAQASYTFMDAEFHKGTFKNNSLPGVPEHKLVARADYEAIPGLFLSANWLLSHDGFRINDFTNSFESDNYGTLDLGLRYAWRNLTAFFTIENVTDEEYTTFQSSSGTSVSTGENPAPPRGYVTGVTVSF